MKIFVTKYALTKGIIEMEGIRYEDNPEIYEVRFRGLEDGLTPNDYCLTKEKAINQADAMRLRRLASLRQQIAKLEKLRFE